MDWLRLVIIKGKKKPPKEKKKINLSKSRRGYSMFSNSHDKSRRGYSVFSYSHDQVRRGYKELRYRHDGRGDNVCLVSIGV